MKVLPIKTKLFIEGDDLLAFIKGSVRRLQDKSILVVTSKIVSLAEGRTAFAKSRERLIQIESDAAIKTKYVWLTLKANILMANAGIDDSNSNGKITLLPKDSMRTAHTLRSALLKHYHVKNLGILITDSNPLPLRAGVVGVALGYAGFKPVRDYRGKLDLFGRKFTFSQTNIADSLATAANVLMGEGAEQQPLAIITEAPAEFTNRSSENELVMDPKTDMYAPLLKPLLKKRRK